MSALNPIIFTRKNPELPAKQIKELKLSEKHECIIEIPSHLLQRAIQTCDTKTELIVYMTILRYSVGFNRNSCTLSRRFISNWTGLQFQNVGRGIEGLIAKGLIERLPESNLKHGDVFRVKHWSESDMTRNQNDYTQATMCNQPENTQGVIKVITERNQLDYEESSKRLRGVISLITKNKKEKLEESSSVSEKLQKHLEAMPQAFQRRTEKQSLTQLLSRYTTHQIEDALEHLQKHGTSSGHKILMPLKYLATETSMENILGLLNNKAIESQKHVQNTQKLIEEKARQIEYEEHQNLREIKAKECFEKTFPSSEAQSQFIAEYLQQRWRSKNIAPSPNTARKLAISYWYKSQTCEVNTLRSGK